MNPYLKKYSLLIVFLLFITFSSQQTLLAASEHPISVDVWKNFLFRSINLLILGSIIYYFTNKAIRNFFVTRRQNIKTTLETLEGQVVRYEKEYNELNIILDDIKNKRESLIEQYRADAEIEGDKIIANAHKTAANIVEKIKLSLEQELKSAKRQLVKETGKLSSHLASEILKSTINESDQDKLTDNFIQEISKLKELN